MVAAPIFFFEDKVAEASTVTASSEATDFDVERLNVFTPQVRWRATGDTSETVTIDLGAAEELDCAALVGHNFTSGVTLTIRGSTDNFSASDVSVATLTYRAGIIFGTWTAVSYRYWRLVIADASNPDTYVELGRFLIGSKHQPSQGFVPGGSSGEQDPSRIHVAMNGVETSVTRPRRETRSETFPLFTTTEHDAWVTFRDYVGTSKPFVVAWDPDNRPNEETRYYKLTSPISFAEEFVPRDGSVMIENVSVTVREEL